VVDLTTCPTTTRLIQGLCFNGLRRSGFGSGGLGLRRGRLDHMPNNNQAAWCAHTNPALATVSVSAPDVGCNCCMHFYSGDTTPCRVAGVTLGCEHYYWDPQPRNPETSNPEHRTLFPDPPHTSSSWIGTQTTSGNPLDLYRRSPESGAPWYTSRASKKRISWWKARAATERKT